MTRALRRAWHRLIGSVRPRRSDDEISEELESHIQMLVDDHVRRGVSLEEAQRLARVRFGSVEATKERYRDQRGLPWLEGAFFDLRLAVRGLRRDRAFTLAAVAMLALAIGLNVTVYTVMDAMLFRGYPLVKNGNRVVFLQERGPGGSCCISYADLADWRVQAKSFDGFASAGGGPVTFRDGEGRPMDMRATAVSVNAFALLGVAPMLGRDFAPGDDVPGAAPVLILSHRFWVNRFARRPDIVGLTVHVNGAVATIVGVMPERFDFPLPIEDDFWMPSVATTEQHKRGLTPGGFTVVARLRDGVSVQEARAELEAINRGLEAAYPETNRGLVPRVATHSEWNSGPDAPMIWGSLWAAAWFVLLIACANLANLTLVRTIGRWREFATRIALGAGQARMIRAIVIESLVLATVAGGAGWWITIWSVNKWVQTTASLYQVIDYTIDGRTLAYLAAVTIIAGIALSVAPVVRVMQLGVSGALKGDARGVTQGLRGKHLSATLVAVQMALAIVLLSGAGVLVRSFVNIVGAETGVRDSGRILAGRVRMPSDAYPSPASRREYLDRLDAALKDVPGVLEEAVASTIPVRGTAMGPLEIEGRAPSPADDPRVSYLPAGVGYFHLIGASTLAGRDFTAGDSAASTPVAIVNESFASKYWPGEDATGKRLRVKSVGASSEWRVVVGVVSNVMQSDSTRQNFRPLVYVPFVQEPIARTAYFLLRTAGPAAQMAPMVRSRVQGIDPDISLENYGSLQASFAFDRDFMDLEHSELGKHAKVAPVFAAIALVLAAIGLYAVLAHSTGQRTKEFAVRMAIGAVAADIRRLVLLDGLRPVAIGVAVGLIGSLAVNRVLQSQLVGVSPYDAGVMSVAIGALALIAFVACEVPARRATNVAPAVALRND